MTRSTLFSRNRLTLLLIKKRRSIDTTGELLSKNFAIFTRKHMCWNRPVTLLKRDSTTDVFPVNIGKFLKKTYFEEHLRPPASEETLRSDWLRLSFWRIAFKNIQTFKPEPPLNLTPTLYFELRFPVSIINGSTERQTLLVPGLLV